jgi:hypothetical protein
MAAIAGLAAAIGLASGTFALADPMSKAEYQVARRNIVSDFKGARIGCEPMRGDVLDICLVDVAGREAIALAELEALYLPGAKTREGVDGAKAQARSALAAARQKTVAVGAGKR